MKTVMKRLVCAFTTKEIAHSANCKSVSGILTPWQGEMWLWMDSICIQWQQLCNRGCSWYWFLLSMASYYCSHCKYVGKRWFLIGARIYITWKHIDVSLWHCPHTPFFCSLKNWGVLHVWSWRWRSCQTQKHKHSWGFSSTAPGSAIAPVNAVFACNSLLWCLL